MEALEIQTGFNRSMLRLLLPEVGRACAGLFVVVGGLAWIAEGWTAAGAVTAASGIVLTVAWGRLARRKALRLGRPGPSLRLDDSGVHVPYGRTGDKGYAVMPWAACARVIARSHHGADGRVRAQYVQFVPRDDAAVEGDLAGPLAQHKARFFKVSPALALMTWVEPHGHRPGIDGVLDHVRTRCPALAVDDWRERA